MFLFRTLSVPGSEARRSPMSRVIVLSLLAQSCTTISSITQRNDQTLALPQVSDDATPGGASVQKISIEPESRKTPPKRKAKRALIGKASWYGPGFNGKKTASGEVYDQTKFTAAHKSLPLGSKARVTNLNNGSSVDVEINDRGPFVDGRIIDLSRAAAVTLGFLESGTAPVKIELIAEPTDSDVAQANGKH